MFLSVSLRWFFRGGGARRPRGITHGSLAKAVGVAEHPRTSAAGISASSAGRTACTAPSWRCAARLHNGHLSTSLTHAIMVVAGVSDGGSSTSLRACKGARDYFRLYLINTPCILPRRRSDMRFLIVEWDYTKVGIHSDIINFTFVYKFILGYI